MVRAVQFHQCQKFIYQLPLEALLSGGDGVHVSPARMVLITARMPNGGSVRPYMFILFAVQQCLRILPAQWFSSALVSD